jgi:hypothetical protein
MAYMKLQPYIQSSVLSRANKKLSFKFFGPFRVLEKIGKVAYMLQLPESSSVYPMVHVSQLRLDAGFKDPIITQLPSDVSQLCFLQQFLGAEEQIKWLKFVSGGQNCLRICPPGRITQL